jgi:hypothetical protein
MVETVFSSFLSSSLKPQSIPISWRAREAELDLNNTRSSVEENWLRHLLMVNQVMMQTRCWRSDESCWERRIKEDVFAVKQMDKLMGTALRKFNEATGIEENKKAKVKDTLKWGMTDLEVSSAIQSYSIDQIKHECSNNFLSPSWKLEDHFISINLKKNIIIN